MSLPDPGQFPPGYQIDVSFVDEFGVTQRVRALANTINWIRVDNRGVIGEPPEEELPVAPVNLTPPGITGATLTGFVLTVDRGTWSGTPAPAFSYQWLADDVPIPGATQQTYLLTLDEVGKAIKVTVTASNTGGTASATSLATALITEAEPPVAPSNTALPTIAGAAVVGQTLTATTGIWTGDPVPTFAFQWLADGLEIGGATAATFPLTTDQLGQAISVRVTATNAGGSANATSAATAAVIPAGGPLPGAPENTVAPAITGTPTIGAILTANQGTWTGSPAPTFAFQWLADGFAIAGATGSAYTLTEDERYKNITCRVTATNAAGSATAQSNQVGQVVGAVAATKRYIRRVAAGAGNGTSWENAATISSLNAFIAQVGEHGQILIRADEGNYSASLITISNAGAPNAPAIIRGVDVNENAMNAVLVGNRTDPFISNGTNTTGPEVIRLQAGAGNLKFRNIEFRRCGNGCFRIGDNIDNLTIEQCAADNVNRFIENNITGTAATASLTNSRIGHCTVRGFSRAFARLRYDGSNILIHDCFGDSESQDGDNFAAGITLSGTFHDSIIARCTMMNCLDSKNGDQTLYWNADGFSQENGNFGIQYVDCVAKGNSDGGFDCKGECTFLRCTAAENKKNFRLWGTATMTECVSRDPFLRGGNSEASHISCHSTDAVATVVNCAVVDMRPATTVFLVQDATAILTVTNTSVQRDPASTLLDNINGAVVTLDLINAPAATVAPAITGLQSAGETLTCTTGTWNDGSATFTFQWCRDGLYIDGETANTYLLTSTDVGRVITCRVFARSASGAVGEAISNATEAIQSVAPENTVLPTISGVRAVGATLTAIAGTWTGAPPPTFTYQWLNSDVAIEGATTQNYVLQAGDLGDVIKVVVTATNGAGSAQATSLGTEPIADELTEVFVMPTSQGLRDGSSWENAISLGSLSGAINPLADGATVYIRADAGDYNFTGSISINNGGAPGNRLTIKGVDVNLADMKAHIIGSRTNWILPVNPEQTTNVSSWTVGNTVFRLNAGSDHIAFKNFFFQNVGTPFHASNAEVDDILIEDIESYNTQEGFFTNNFAISNVTIRRWKATGFSKRIVRAFNDCHDFLIEDFWLNSGRQDRDNFAIGIALNDTAHNITIRGTVPGGIYPGIIENCSDTEGSGYWNADGITTERDNHDILIENVTSRGHTDAGIDSKATNTTIRNCLCYDNKKNFRLWGNSGMLVENCVSRDPFKRGGTSSTAYMHIIGKDSRSADPGIDMTVKECTFDSLEGQTASAWSMIDENIYNVIMRELDNTFGAGIVNGSLPGNSLKLSGSVADVTQPTINNSTTYNAFSNAVFSVPLTADKPVSWRISGGADQAKFEVVDGAGVANLVGQTLRMEKTLFTGVDDSYEVIVEAKDANSNTNTKTITITVLNQAPPLTFQTLFEGANDQTTPIADDAGGKTINFANGGKLTSTTPLEGVTSLLVNGDTDCAQCAGHDDFNVGSGEFSLIALIRPSNIAAGFGTVLSYGTSSTNERSYRFGVTTAGALDFLYSSNGNTTINLRSANALLANNTTYEIAVDRDDVGNLRLYIDGAMVAKAAISGALNSPPSDFFRMGRSSAINEGFRGRIDNVRTWKGYAFCASDAGYTP